MVDYQGNSHKGKDAEAKQIVKVVTGEVVVKEPGLGSKFKGVFFGGDLSRSLKFVAADVILPATRDLVVDAIVNAVKGVIYGEGGRRRRTPEYSSRTIYNAPVNRYQGSNVRSLDSRRIGPPDQGYRQPRPERNQYLFTNRPDAERVLETLIEIVERYQVASLSDLYGLMGLDATPIDNKWGWTYLNNVQIRQSQDGWMLDFPELEAI